MLHIQPVFMTSKTISIPALSRFQHFLSWLYPVKVAEAATPENPLLELFYFRGQWQLGTADALYSDGTRYRPLALGFSKIREKLPEVRQALFLGAGLGSGAQILYKAGCHPDMTLVDADATVLAWAEQVLPLPVKENCSFIRADARLYLQADPRKYDLIAVDVFIGRKVPGFVLEPAFLKESRSHLNPGGILILNYIENEPQKAQHAAARFQTVFPEMEVQRFGMNYLFTGYNLAD